MRFLGESQHLKQSDSQVRDVGFSSVKTTSSARPVTMPVWRSEGSPLFPLWAPALNSGPNTLPVESSHHLITSQEFA